MRKRVKICTKFMSILLIMSILILPCFSPVQVYAAGNTQGVKFHSSEQPVDDITIDEIPEFEGDSIIELKNNEPDFSKREKNNTKTFEIYSELDDLGRCGVAFVNISKDTMPDVERGAIGSVKPSGWHTVKYSDIIDGNYVFNRCHLIAYSLAGENANEENLITGFRYFNTPLMLRYESQILDYVKETDNHVLYRVTPLYADTELVARGVEMEAWSVEDSGDGICFHVFVYNVQPGIGIDYETGETWEDSTMVVDGLTDTVSSDVVQRSGKYVLNIKTKKIHSPDCDSVKQMAEHNKLISNESLEELISEGYKTCGNCHGK